MLTLTKAEYFEKIDHVLYDDKSCLKWLFTMLTVYSQYSVCYLFEIKLLIMPILFNIYDN